MKTVDFSETIAASDLKVGRCRQQIEFMMVCEYWRSRSFLYHIFSRLCFTRPIYQETFTGPLVLWFKLDMGLGKDFSNTFALIT